MMDANTASTETVRIEVFLRNNASAAVVEPLKAIVARAHRLEERAGDADVRVKTWTSVRPALEELGDAEPSVSPTVDTFESWADREGYTLRPAFERHETESMLSRRSTTEIQVPTVCVAVYEDDDLQCVAPCSDGDRTYTVENCLNALEDGSTEPFADRDEPILDRLDDSVENHARTEKGE
ncbi:HTH domain-containing protein [Natrinema sp. SYSU A 869]|uniref:HTH domain-containing protein n=1 Tax=Natrinema sp. SYSU A 869 TaxID=2871694 RepID=UPI001CA3FC65|nr:HTH domain-containing protein [Natrinema sp. SYSU A 869]